METIHGRFWCEASDVGNSFEAGGLVPKRVEIWTETRQNVPKFKGFFFEIETAIGKIRQIVVACGLFQLQFPEGSVLGNPPEIIQNYVDSLGSVQAGELSIVNT